MHYQLKMQQGKSFSITYGAKATSLVEVGIPSPYCIHFNEIINDELRMYEPLKKGKGCLLDEARYVPTKNDPLL